MPSPRILSAVAAPQTLPSQGGAVRLVAHVRDATSCVFLGQRGPFGSLGQTAPIPCASGSASASLRVGANRTGRPVQIHFHVRATGDAGHVVQAGLTVTEAAAVIRAGPPLAIITTSLAQGWVGSSYVTGLLASGGTPPFTWTLVSGALPPGLTLAANGRISGMPTSAGTFSFVVRVTDAATPVAQTATAQLSIDVAAPVPLGRASANWSGYVLSGGPFTTVTGTFDVPSIGAASADTGVAEWVGLDGASPSDTALIQAGVQEAYDFATGTVRTYAWWEVLPALETVVSLPVQPGDRVTVSLTQIGAGQWDIEIEDDSTGQTFATTQAYTGPGATAEWIVEAPTSGLTGTPMTLADYQPDVTFTGLRVTGTQGPLLALTMTAGAGPISVPSALTANGFAVAYGSTAPSPP